MSAQRCETSRTAPIALALFGAALLCACRSGVSSTSASAPAPAPNVVAPIESASKPSAARQVIWTSAPLKEHAPDPISWTHGEQAHVYRGVDLSRLCAASIAQRSSIDPTRATWDRMVVVSGRDGSRALFSAAELRPDWGPTRAWLCDEQDGAALPAGDGPYRLIVTSDGGGARCVRQVVEIAVIDVSSVLAQRD